MSRVWVHRTKVSSATVLLVLVGEECYLPHPPVSQPSVVPFPLQQLFVSALVNGDFRIVLLSPG